MMCRMSRLAEAMLRLSHENATLVKLWGRGPELHI
jgi:hypothetical protein